MDGDNLQITFLKQIVYTYDLKLSFIKQYQQD